MQVARTVGWWGRLGVLLAISGCSGGDERETGFGGSTPTTPMSAGGATTEPEPTSTAGSTSDGVTSTSAGMAGSSGSTGAISGGSTDGSSITDNASSTGDSNDTSTGGGVDETTSADSSTGVTPSCGDGIVDPGEACDDGNQVDGDECLNSCVAAACGDGVVQVGVEGCDDGNQADDDACRNSCVAAACGDGVVQVGVEGCDDGNKIDGDGCSAACKSECGNVGGGSLSAENGTGMNKKYCYEQGDSIDTRARKACESHFGVGACCIIMGGYSNLQWGQCNQGGGAGTFHFHPDAHPNGHCEPNYKVGDVVAPGWCGTVIGNFLD